MTVHRKGTTLAITVLLITAACSGGGGGGGGGGAKSSAQLRERLEHLDGAFLARVLPEASPERETTLVKRLRDKVDRATILYDLAERSGRYLREEAAALGAHPIASSSSPSAVADGLRPLQAKINNVVELAYALGRAVGDLESEGDGNLFTITELYLGDTWAVSLSPGGTGTPRPEVEKENGALPQLLSSKEQRRVSGLKGPALDKEVSVAFRVLGVTSIGGESSIVTQLLALDPPSRDRLSEWIDKSGALALSTPNLRGTEEGRWSELVMALQSETQQPQSALGAAVSAVDDWASSFRP